jgi:hypothetical protein
MKPVPSRMKTPHTLIDSHERLPYNPIMPTANYRNSRANACSAS